MTTSAGILLYRLGDAEPRVLLAHPGGPYFAKRDLGAWTIPKGMIADGEPPEDAAIREFEEEMGWRPVGPLLPLGKVKQRSGKRVIGFALRSEETEEALLAKFSPGTFQMEWPPKSGAQVAFPEVDRIAFFDVQEAQSKIIREQAPFLDRLTESLADS
jgi:predicted NUDIX family NTP pyrophosphohydrolase